MNINPVQKICRLAAVSSIHDGAPNRSARDAKRKAHYKNSEPLEFPKLYPKPDDVQGAIFIKYIIDNSVF